MSLLNFIDSVSIDFKTIFYYIFSAGLQERLIFVQLAFIIISIILTGLIIFTLSRTHYLQWLFVEDIVQFFTMRPFGAKKITKQWNKVLDYLKAGSESEYKLAVIEADDMLDAVLKRLGYTGETFEEKLGKLTSATLPNIKQLYEIHQLRNNIVHDPDYRLTLDEAKKSLNVYSQAFQDLQILGE